MKSSFVNTPKKIAEKRVMRKQYLVSVALGKRNFLKTAIKKAVNNQYEDTKFQH